MILKISGKEYPVKTDWKEFTFNEYAKVVSCSGKSLVDRLNVYTGIPKDLIDKLTMEQISFIGEAVQFMDEPDNALLFCKDYKDDLNIGRRTYKEIEQALIFIRKTDKPVTVLDKVVKIYYGEEIGEQPIYDCIGRGLFVLDLISKFLNEFKRLSEYEPSQDEIQAGVEDLSKFGFFATAVQLARKYGKTHDEILAMPAREVYTTLLYDFEQSEVEKRLMEIRSKKR